MKFINFKKINNNFKHHPLFVFLWISLGLLLNQCSGPSPELDIYKSNGSLKPTQRPYSIKDRTYYPQEHYEYDVQGIASWYGPGFHGRMTSTGDVFDENRLTAAHNTLPLPCIVRVTNLSNQRVINLEVNDRGPFSRERIIDVSRRAAQLLGFLNQGVTSVRVECLVQESRQLNQRYRLERAQRLKERQQRAQINKKVALPLKKAKPHLEIDQKFVTLLKENAKRPTPLSTLVLGKSTLSKLPSSVAMTKTLQKTVNSKSLILPKMHLNKNFILPAEMFVLSLGHFDTAVKAKQAAKKFIKIAPIKILKSKKGYEVRLGPIKTIKEAENMVKQLLKLHHQPAKILKAGLIAKN